MKKIGSLIKTVLIRGCIFFTALTLFLWGAASAVAAGNSTDWSFKSETFGVILLFSFLAALVSLVLSARFIAVKALRIGLHFVLTLASFILFLSCLGTLQASGIFILSAAFTALYGIGLGIVLMLTAKKRKKENGKREYKAQFGGQE